MHAAQQPASAFDTRARKVGPTFLQAVYTSSNGSAASNNSTADSASQDAINASV
jgi:hypothetical protein